MINRSLDSFISHDFSVNLPFHQLNTSKSDLVVFIVFSFFFILQVAASLTRSLLYVCVVAGGELG